MMNQWLLKAVNIINTDSQHLMDSKDFISFADKLPDGMILVSSQGEILAINRKAVQLLKLTKQQLNNQSLSLISDLAEQEIVARLKLCAGSRTPTPLGIKLSNQACLVTDGFLFTPAAASIPAQIILRLEKAQPSLSKYQTLTNEVEKHKKALKLLNQNRDELSKHKFDLERLVTERTKQFEFHRTSIDEHTIVSITDAKGLITYANKKFEEISLYSAQELIGRNHNILNSGHHSHSFFKEMWSTISSGKTWHGEICNRAKGGGLYWVSTTIAPKLDEEGKPEQYISIRTDFTHLKKLEADQKEINRLLVIEKEQSEKEKRKADKANQAKTDFLSSMSHELRTPLNAILGFAQLLDYDTDCPLSGDQKAKVSHILSSGEHLLNLINDVLELSAIESNKLEVSIEAIHVNKLLDDIKTLMAPIAGKANIQMNIQLGACFDVQADHIKLKQALINLINNAIKYNKANGRVDINWMKTQQNTVKLTVIDTGIGIPEKQKNKVFGAFNRLGQETSTIEGTGIGLVVTKNLVEAMNGKIGFESTEGQGSTFWIELPLAEKQLLTNDTVSPLLEKEEKREAENKKNKQVLYVEDNPTNRQLMKAIFDRKTHALTIAETGELGLQIALEQNFDLILMDIHLPGIDGKEVTKQLRKHEHYKNVPIVALSAAAMKHDIQSAEGLFDDYLTKPLHIPQLHKLLRESL